MTTARYIPLANIRRRTDARAIDRENVDGIKASIREVGLLSPVIVRHADSNTFELIAGNHRFVAVQELGEPDILAIDLADLDDLKAELAMIDENLRRAEGDMLWFEIAREVANGSDTLGVDAKLIALEVYIINNAGTDA